MESISVIIVSWNARDYLRDCLDSIGKAGASRVREIIVVDNGSEDGSPEMVAREFPEAILIRCGENLGFARANNLGMRQAAGSLFALVNSDAVVHPGCLETLAACFEQDAGIGLAGPRIIGGDGRLQRTCRRLPTVWNTLCRLLALDRLFPGWPAFSGFELTDSAHGRTQEAEVLSGCFCVARKQAVDAVGGLDERYFFYGEDIDWCKRFRDAGWKLLFVAEATATHFGGASTSNAPLRYSIEILRATLQYWRKHHGLAGQAACYLLLAAHHGLRISIRAAKRCLGLGDPADLRRKLREDYVCLRWLLMGNEPNEPAAPPAAAAEPR